MKKDDYSLMMLSDWVKESMESGYTPQQVYETIVRTVRESRDYHRASLNHAEILFNLLKSEELPEHYDNFENPLPEQDTTNFSGDDYSPEARKHWDDFWESLKLNPYALEYTPIPENNDII
tara:strand:+ start:400 stop:762 length:363 start_codon:yes stop_codon:yes gene_type:complete